MSHLNLKQPLNRRTFLRASGIGMAFLFLESMLPTRATTATAAAEERHIFILSGQSNMVRINPGDTFRPEAEKLLPGATIEVVKEATGGKPIRNWLAEWDAIAQEAGLDPEALRSKDKVKGSPYFERIIEKTKPLFDPPPASLTFIWLQGESDSGKTSAPYESSLNALIAKLRKELNFPEMNVVIARISDSGLTPGPRQTDTNGWETIRKAQENVVAADKRAALVTTDDVNGPKDGLHYPKEGYELLGRRMARQATALIKGETPDPEGDPE